LNLVFQKLQEKGAKLRTIEEKITIDPILDDNVFRIVAALVDIEVERARTGKEAAKEAGKLTGRPQKLNQEQIKKAQQLEREGKSKAKIAELLEVSRSTAYRLLEEK
jgi:DNA invertase Pin-like site-specific DNA recombinase